MKLKQLIITQEERNEAVEIYLAARGIKVKVEDVKPTYSSGGGHEVECTVEAPEPVTVAAEMPEVENNDEVKV